jgi:hypothetical protein
VSQPSVCVVLPVKNGSRYIAQAIESVLAQSGVELTVRVIDNRSEDDSVAIANQYLNDSRVSVAVNDEDYRYYGSLNRALVETDADYFVPFACDDLMLPGNLACKVGWLEETGAALAHSTAVSMDENGAISNVVWDHGRTPPLAEPPSFFPQLIPTNRLVCPSAVVRCEALRSLGGFDARDEYAADWLAWLQLALRFRVVTMHEPLVAYRAHPDSCTSRVRQLGLLGFYGPATVARALGDSAFPPAWGGWCDRLMAMTYAQVAETLYYDGVKRQTQGWSAYVLQGLALARQPHDSDIQRRYHELVEDAGLVSPSLPFEAVTIFQSGAWAASSLASAVGELGPLLGRLFIHVRLERLDEALSVLEPVFEESAVHAVVVPTAEPDWSQSAGRIAIAPWQSPVIAAAESFGLPTWPSALPSPFERAADSRRWETLPAVRAVAPPNLVAPV